MVRCVLETQPLTIYIFTALLCHPRRRRGVNYLNYLYCSNTTCLQAYGWYLTGTYTVKYINISYCVYNLFIKCFVSSHSLSYRTVVLFKSVLLFYNPSGLRAVNGRQFVYVNFLKTHINGHQHGKTFYARLHFLLVDNSAFSTSVSHYI